MKGLQIYTFRKSCSPWILDPLDIYRGFFFSAGPIRFGATCCTSTKCIDQQHMRRQLVKRTREDIAFFLQLF